MFRFLKFLTVFMAIGVLTGTIGCTSKIKEIARDAQYSAYETIGIEKRDLFKKQVAKVKEAQDDSKEEFQDALSQLKKVYGVDGGNLEKEYRKLKDSYDDANEEANQVRSDIARLDTIAEDLFREWEKEISEITNADLRAKSIARRNETRTKYNAYFTQLKASEKRMSPVLKKFNDQVLYLKHNLNANAIAGLKSEATRIESDISALIQEMNQSIQKADELILTL